MIKRNSADDDFNAINPRLAPVAKATRRAVILEANKCPRLPDVTADLPWLSLRHDFERVPRAISLPLEFVEWGKSRVGRAINYEVTSVGGLPVASVWYEASN